MGAEVVRINDRKEILTRGWVSHGGYNISLQIIEPPFSDVDKFQEAVDKLLGDIAEAKELLGNTDPL